MSGDSHPAVEPGHYIKPNCNIPLRDSNLSVADGLKIIYCRTCRYHEQNSECLKKVCGIVTSLSPDELACSKYKPKVEELKLEGRGAFDYIDRIMEKTPVHFDKSGQFWIWTAGGYYKPIDITEILLSILKSIADPAIIESRFKNELLEAARLRGRDADVKPVPRDWIHVQNGVYDIKTGELFESNPDYLFTEPIPHKIIKSEATPTIDRLFSEWVAPEKMQLLHEIAAYCLYNGYPIHRIFILLGRGRNGKGQYRDFIVNLIGTHNRTASTLEQLINSRFETARLFNKKLCTMGEINYSLLDRTAILKMLSGGDPIPAEMKGKSPFDYVNFAKMLLNANSLPQTTDKTDAFYSRCIVVDFCNQFPLSHDIVETIPPEEYDNYLTKSIRVLRELLARGEFSGEGDIRTKESEYEKHSNPLNQFINMFYKVDKDGKVAAWRLFKDYNSYCEEKGIRKPPSKSKFNEMLKVDFEVEKGNLQDDIDKEWHCWVWIYGLKPRDDLSHLSHLSKVPIDSYMKAPTEKQDKTDKLDKNSLLPSVKILSNDTNIFHQKMDKSDTICGICGQSLNGNSETLGLGLGKIHPVCKFTPLKIRILSTVPKFVGADERLYGPYGQGEEIDIPTINALIFINKHTAEKVNA